MGVLKDIKNNIVNWLIVRYYTFKGKMMRKKFIVGETYYNTMKKTYGIYRGNNTFYETKQCVVPEAGTIFYDSRNYTYTDLQIGLFKLFEKCDAEIDTSNDNVVDGDRLLLEGLMEKR